MSSLSKEVLNIKNLKAIYPHCSNWVLDGLNLQIKQGEKLALIGSSGCGKSTVAKAVMQLLPIGSSCKGLISLNGTNILGLDEISLQTIRGQQVGLIFQDPMSRLNPLMTIGDHLVDTLLAHRSLDSIHILKKRAKELLEKVGISPMRFKSFPHELSGGMQQRVAIALAIALNPPLVIADEPTTSLDSIISNQIMSELSLLCDEFGTALLLISHDLSLAAKWCNKIAILDCGKIIELGESKNIICNPKSKIAQRLVGSARLKQETESKNIFERNELLKVQSLRCWHNLGYWPFSSIWIKAVNEVTFSLCEGETLGVVGPSGCGKSTLCRAVMGLIPLRGGTINFQGEDMATMNRKNLRQFRKNIQIIFQDPYSCLNPKMSVLEAVMDPILIHNLSSRLKSKEKARELLELVGLNPCEFYEKRLPHQLSGGQQQRVVIARALTLEPKILICDESVSMLDAEVQVDVLQLLDSLQKKFKLSILFITHDLSVAAGFCHRIIIFDKGRIIEENSGRNIFRNAQSGLTQKLVEASPRLPVK